MVPLFIISGHSDVISKNLKKILISRFSVSECFFQTQNVHIVISSENAAKWYFTWPFVENDHVIPAFLHRNASKMVKMKIFELVSNVANGSWKNLDLAHFLHLVGVSLRRAVRGLAHVIFICITLSVIVSQRWLFGIEILIRWCGYRWNIWEVSQMLDRYRRNLCFHKSKN